MRRRLPQTPRLTQGSLADICAGGSSNNELGVRADLLERSPQSKVTIAGRSLWVQPLPLLLLDSEGFEESSRCLSSDPAPFVLMRGGEGGGKGNFQELIRPHTLQITCSQLLYAVFQEQGVHPTSSARL